MLQTRGSPLDVEPEANKIDSQFPSTAIQEQRSKRGVIHLYNMVSCATGCNPLIYKGYGCYCGFLGSGYAVDGIDRCCKSHDWCYDTANCPMFLEYFVPYYWKCSRNRPYCGKLVGYGSWKSRLRLVQHDSQYMASFQRSPRTS
jgi:secretory phospholipase A2